MGGYIYGSKPLTVKKCVAYLFSKAGLCHCTRILDLPSSCYHNVNVYCSSSIQYHSNGSSVGSFVSEAAHKDKGRYTHAISRLDQATEDVRETRITSDHRRRSDKGSARDPTTLAGYGEHPRGCEHGKWSEAKIECERRWEWITRS